MLLGWRRVVNGESRPTTINRFSYLFRISRIDTCDAVPVLCIFPHDTRPESAERQESIVNVSAYVEPLQRVNGHSIFPRCWSAPLVESNNDN